MNKNEDTVNAKIDKKTNEWKMKRWNQQKIVNVVNSHTLKLIDWDTHIIPLYTNVNTHIHACTCIHTHTHIHTYIRTHSTCSDSAYIIA